jgi:diguanylate cyclase (GGDEF)-like protein/PAS domain S-box-containing protein
MANAGDEPERPGQLEVDLRESWAALNGFDLVYQPQFNLKNRDISGFEALLRWYHPVHGQVPPAKFIPLAEKMNLIDDIGRWVLERACQDAATWPGHVSLAVNVSANQLHDAALPAIVAAALQASGLPPSRLELEITETAMLPVESTRLDYLHQIQGTGVRIVMDDFDIGYSALGYLLQFPFNKIKLDHAFIDGIPEDRNRYQTARAIVRAIVGLCNDLNITFLAEGIETTDQFAYLAEVGCTEIQGYLCGRPHPAAHVPDVLRSAPALLQRLTSAAGQFGTTKSPPGAIPFSQIFEAARDIIIVTTPDLEPPGPKILYVNPAFTRLTGYSAADAIGLSPRILQGPGTNRTTLDAIKIALKAGQPVHQKILNFGRSGAPYWLDLHIVALRDAANVITHFAAIERDVTMDKRRLDELEHLADRDTLTGIPNRRAFLRATESEIASAAATRIFGVAPKGPCLAYIDVDHFKLVNDGLGHPIGDAVLCGVADCLTENIRRLDILGRIGGEEFAVCMPSVTLEEAKTLAERLRLALAGAQMATPTGPVSITVSIGVACFTPADTLATMTGRADAAMYAAKRAGRNRVRAHVPKSRDRIARPVTAEPNG